ncbi:hypothetical protein [Priestia koreensis]|uniref:hypothetical protein n=1 Tax=Priestia koreensis TaxID=284581 RepID=UPI00301AF250
MSKKAHDLKCELVSTIDRLFRDVINILQEHISGWMVNQGIKPGTKYVKCECIASSDSKMDVIVHFEDSAPLKISAKLSSGEYFGNWYSHKRILQEFGEDSFNRLVEDCKKWENSWKDNLN